MEFEVNRLDNTVALHSPSCLIEHFGLGELSLYEGFEHVSDELGRIEAPLTEGASHTWISERIALHVSVKPEWELFDTKGPATAKHFLSINRSPLL